MNEINIMFPAILQEGVPYKVRLSRRARRMRIAVYCDSSVVVTLPVGLDVKFVDKFVKAKSAWIKKTLKHFQPFRNRPIIKTGRREYKLHRQRALDLAQAKVKQWNNFYKFEYHRVNIKNQKTRWGSCSKKANLNFNWKIVHLPEALVDYLAVHELCHLKEMNHSQNFWMLVSQTVPNYKKLRSELKNFSSI